jgi:hypothetical protein
MVTKKSVLPSILQKGTESSKVIHVAIPLLKLKYISKHYTDQSKIPTAANIVC